MTGDLAMNVVLTRTILRGIFWVGAILGSAAALGTVARPPACWIASHRGYRANLAGANIQGTGLAKVNLQRANLQQANLQGADLAGALLMGANLRKADLRGADLLCTFLGGGCGRSADLTGADLRGTDLQHTDLEFYSRDGFKKVVPLTGARYDARTRWPAGFDPVKHGAVRVE
jgi:uncharacterized protein YjbI with pentapeptide repeats